MDLSEQHKIGEIYTREIPEKYFYVKPCGKSLKDIDKVEILKSFWDMPLSEDDYEMAEYGFLYEHSETMYYFFIEIPKNLEIKNKKIIPPGNYFCLQNKESIIENSLEIFKNQIGNSFLAIETEIFTARHKINKPISELRVMVH
jgi:hypothetical protein